MEYLIIILLSSFAFVFLFATYIFKEPAIAGVGLVLFFILGSNIYFSGIDTPTGETILQNITSNTTISIDKTTTFSRTYDFYTEGIGALFIAMALFMGYEAIATAFHNRREKRQSEDSI